MLVAGGALGALRASCARSMAMVSVSEVFVFLASEVVRVLAEKLELGLVVGKIFFSRRYLC